jgi:hypothetical protein
MSGAAFPTNQLYARFRMVVAIDLESISQQLMDSQKFKFVLNLARVSRKKYIQLQCG